MIKLIATDMDGTWLKENKTYDKELFEKEFQIMQDRDIKFVVASGNQYEKILKIADLSDDDYNLTLKIVSNLPYQAVVAGVTSAYVRKSDGEKFAQEMTKFFNKIQVVDNFKEIDDRIFKVSLNVPAEIMPVILAELRSLYSQIDFVAGASTSIDMQTKGMNKAVGLEYLGKKLGIKSSEMIAFGDSGNDEAMLKYVGTSFATATALPEAKKAANQIIGSSEDSSVQKKILELLS